MRANTKYVSIAVLLVLSLVASFGIPRRDLHSMAQVAGIALDKVDDSITATFELYKPISDQPIGSQHIVVDAQGKSIADCIKRLKQVYSMELYLNNASVLILSSEQLVDDVIAFYSLLVNDHMDLPVFFAEEQAADFFEGSKEVMSTHLADSAKRVSRIQTVRDLMNGSGQKVFVRGRGDYEILL